MIIINESDININKNDEHEGEHFIDLIMDLDYLKNLEELDKKLLYPLLDVLE